MLVEMRGKSQITIPSEIVKSLGIKEGDKYDVIEKDVGIFLCPVVVYPIKEIIITKFFEHGQNKSTRG